ncbi:MAG: TfoX/Sxy family protein [Thermoplasmata archaeon]
MTYDEALADRVRALLSERTDVEEKRMFGGLTFMVAGNMCVGIVKEDLMVRVGADRHEEASARTHARPMDFTRRTPKGFVFVGPEGVAGEDDLQGWLTWATDFVESLAKRS